MEQGKRCPSTKEKQPTSVILHKLQQNLINPQLSCPSYRSGQLHFQSYSLSTLSWFRTQPRNTGRDMGIHPGWDTSASRAPLTHSFTPRNPFRITSRKPTRRPDGNHKSGVDQRPWSSEAVMLSIAVPGHPGQLYEMDTFPRQLAYTKNLEM